ncbi:MAG: glycosyltransferase family 2 protein [Verrucomicrobiota bacterium]
MSPLPSEMSVVPTHDLAVCYRIYPRVSGRPIFGFTEKLSLVRLNLTTFKEAIGNLKVKIWFILDNCPVAYSELVRSTFPRTDFELIILDGAGNEATFVRQIEVLTRQSAAELVYFAEDDYLYLPGSLERGVAFLRRHAAADFLTLYDHSDYHTKYIHGVKGDEFQEDGHRWHTISSTCLTFLARKNSLVETVDVFQSYGRKNSDLGLWLALTKVRALNPCSFVRSLGDGMFFAASHFLAWRHAWRQLLFGKRRTLWVATPSLATHMEISGLAPAVDWEKLFKPTAKPE